MFQLKQAGERTYYIDNHNIVGIYLLNEKEVCLIDTGDGDKAAEKIQATLEENGWSLKYIINTHTHIDHLGGNPYLMERWNCPAYCTKTDRAFAEIDALEAAYMFGGYPCKDLMKLFRHPGLLGFQDIEEFQLPEGMEYVLLPGHTFGMIGIKTPDNVWFLGDSVLNRESLEKYSFGYLYDVNGFLETLSLLETLDGNLFIPAHGDVVSDIRPLVKANRDNIYKNIDTILGTCQNHTSFDSILKEVFDQYNIKPNVIQHAVVGSTLRCYLTYLQDSGKLEYQFRDNVLTWSIK